MKSLSCRFTIALQQGFTLLELIISIGILGIIFTIATPSLLDYKRSLDYKTTAREITTILRKARSTAVSANQPQMVVFKPNSSSYNWISYNTTSASWTGVVLTKTAPNTVLIRSTVAGTATANVYVQFNTNGTANLKAPSGAGSDGNVSINSGAVQKYVITTTNTGRVSILKK